MDSMVEENGSVNSGQDPLASPESNNTIPIVSSVQSSSQQQHHLVAATNIVHLTLPNQTQAQVQSVIQPNQQSVIQTAANIQPMLSKGNVILVSSKPNSVIHTTAGSLQTIQVVETGSDESYSDEDSPKKRRDLLTRRPSYRKILNDLGGGEIAVIPAGTFQVASQGEGVQGLHTITMTNATAGGAIVQYGQGQDGQQFFVPVVQGGALAGGSVMDEDQTRKREMRLLKNREAARECRRKKKEYIKCLENRVAVLETQNKALIDELKSLKELYCQQKTD
ncbi:cyclic AMP-responsive element-binding protein 1 isoform X5 [Chrysoperla carnea]|uniref:cyclic AMP-responsive element-binding protein 1 isoform X5 n=1 Tax=Chrysoperla carnea TaxID=189513 RepID=UPI001D072FA3|nr:cyclic AMP-responsive element-binding protein 1 isoform X5 [Chrysoperla carnea]